MFPFRFEFSCSFERQEKKEELGLWFTVTEELCVSRICNIFQLFFSPIISFCLKARCEYASWLTM